MPINLLFDLANYTPADASPVQSNLQQIEQYLNQEVITRDGLVAMTAALRLANSTPVNVLDAASKGYIDGLITSLVARSGFRLTVAVGTALTTGASVVMPMSAAEVEANGDWWTSGTNIVVPAGCGGVYNVGGAITSSLGEGVGPSWRVNGLVQSPVFLTAGLVLTPGDVVTAYGFASGSPAGTVAAGSHVWGLRVSS
jgi:hypothetical protein